MSRILAIDYGKKRVGLAVTDPLQLIARPLTTLPTAEVFTFLQRYLREEPVDTFVVGLPKHLNNTPSPMTTVVERFVEQLENKFPKQRIVLQDERYTSKLAAASMLESGLSKKERRNKATLDQLSATIILQSFLANSAHSQSV